MSSYVVWCVVFTVTACMMEAGRQAGREGGGGYLMPAVHDITGAEEG